MFAFNASSFDYKQYVDKKLETAKQSSIITV